MSFQERIWHSADGLQLYARDYSAPSETSKLPVVCLHGLTRNSRDFEDLAPLIAANGRRAIVPDVRGRGKSGWDPNPANYNFGVYASDAISLLNALDVEQAVFLGTSMGGAISMTMAATAGPRISSAILNDVGGEVSAEGLARISSYVGKPSSVADWTDAVAYARDIIGEALPRRDTDCWDKIARRIFVENEAGRPVLDYDPAIMAAGDAPAEGTVSLWTLFDILTKGRPVLALRGGLSDILTQQVADRMRERAPDLTLEIIPDVGHAPLLDEPEAIDAVLKFLARVA